MNIQHRVEIGHGKVTIDRLLEAVARFDIPSEAMLFESEDSYDIVIEWTEGDE